MSKRCEDCEHAVETHDTGEPSGGEVWCQREKRCVPCGGMRTCFEPAHLVEPPAPTSEPWQASEEQAADMARRVDAIRSAVDPWPAAANVSAVRRALTDAVRHQIERLRAELAAWTQAAQAVVDALDPFRPSASPALLKATVLGMREANAALRAEVEGLRAERIDLVAKLDEWQACADRRYEQLSAARAEVERLRGALRAIVDGSPGPRWEWRSLPATLGETIAAARAEVERLRGAEQTCGVSRPSTCDPFPNLAGNDCCNEIILQELRHGEIEPVLAPYDRRHSEVRYSAEGVVWRFRFRRAWSYWVATGPMPLEMAEAIYGDENARRVTRAGGDRACRPPATWVDGSGNVPVYHLDTPCGLRHFVRAVRRLEAEWLEDEVGRLHAALAAAEHNFLVLAGGRGELVPLGAGQDDAPVLAAMMRLRSAEQRTKKVGQERQRCDTCAWHTLFSKLCSAWNAPSPDNGYCHRWEPRKERDDG
jgi:hypothetical protein